MRESSLARERGARPPIIATWLAWFVRGKTHIPCGLPLSLMLRLGHHKKHQESQQLRGKHRLGGFQPYSYQARGADPRVSGSFPGIPTTSVWLRLSMRKRKVFEESHSAAGVGLFLGVFSGIYPFWHTSPIFRQRWSIPCPRREIILD